MPAKDIAARRRIDRLADEHSVFASYCSHLRRRGFAPRTLETYADCLITFARWLTEERQVDVVTITGAHLDKFLVDLSRRGQDGERAVGVGRRGVYVAVLRSFYRFAVEQRFTLANPATDLRSPKIPKRLHRDILTPQELRRLLRSLDDPDLHRDNVAVRLLALSGLRASEAIALDVADVDLPQREVRVQGKGGRQRLVFIDQSTQRVTAQYLIHARPTLARGSEQALLVSDAGHRLDRSQLLAIVKRHVRVARIGKPVTCHSLRRTFCTLLLQSGVAGMNLKVIGELAGHRRLRTTARYAAVDAQSLARVYHQAHPRAGAALVDQGDNP